MSQKFKLRFDQMQENHSPVSSNSTENNEHECYPSSGNTRNVCFVLDDGSSIFLNYAYLVSAELENNDTIVLGFTSHKITIRGSKLEELFKLFMEHRPQYLRCSSSRYAELSNEQEFVISEIIIEAF